MRSVCSSLETRAYRPNQQQQHNSRRASPQWSTVVPDPLEMDKNAPPPYGWSQAPSAAPPSYAQAVGGVGPSSPFTPAYPPNTGPAIVTTVVPVGPHPTHMICPSCHAEIDTAIETKPGLIAYISGCIILLFGCCLGCCLIPCCIDDCMDVHHKCPNCNSYLGKYRRVANK